MDPTIAYPSSWRASNWLWARFWFVSRLSGPPRENSSCRFRRSPKSDAQDGEARCYVVTYLEQLGLISSHLIRRTILELDSWPLRRLQRLWGTYFHTFYSRFWPWGRSSFSVRQLSPRRPSLPFRYCSYHHNAGSRRCSYVGSVRVTSSRAVAFLRQCWVGAPRDGAGVVACISTWLNNV